MLSLSQTQFQLVWTCNQRQVHCTQVLTLSAPTAPQISDRSSLAPKPLLCPSDSKSKASNELTRASWSTNFSFA